MEPRGEIRPQRRECIALLHEWADTVGRAAGLDPVRDIVLISGNIGAIESTIELEIRTVEFCRGFPRVGAKYECEHACTGAGGCGRGARRGWDDEVGDFLTVHPFSTGNSK